MKQIEENRRPTLRTDLSASRTENIRAVIAYLMSVSGVDFERIGILGICGDSSYTIQASKTGKSTYAVAGFYKERAGSNVGRSLL